MALRKLKSIQMAWSAILVCAVKFSDVGTVMRHTVTLDLAVEEHSTAEGSLISMKRMNRHGHL